MTGEFLFDDVGAADEMNLECRRKVLEGETHPCDLRARGVITPHGIQGDPDHPQASSTSILFLPP
jgi:hypothetical protein